MSGIKRRRLSGSIAFGIAMGLFLILIALPSSRWLVRSEIQAATGGEPLALREAGGGRLTDAERQQEQQAADRLASDVPVQIAATIRAAHRGSDGEGDSRRAWHALRDLSRRYPDSPAIRASLLRYLMRVDIQLWRPEEESQAEDVPLDPDTRKWCLKQIHEADSPEALAAFEEAATEGERLDSQNAFFPLMYACERMVVHRDTEALTALHRAAQKSEWNDYANDATAGSWRLTHAAHGGLGALAQYAEAADVDLPHYTDIAHLAWIVTYAAIQKEKAGRVEEGIAIRQDLVQCAAILCSTKDSLVAVFPGAAIVYSASSLPGGILPPASDLPGRVQIRRNAARRYIAYLERHGHSREAVLFHAQDIVAQHIQGEYRQQAERDERLLQDKNRRLVFLALVGTALLCGVFGMLLSGGIAAVVVGTRYVRDGRPLLPGIRWGLVSAVAGFLAIGIGNLRGDNNETLVRFAFTAIGITALATFPYMKSGVSLWRALSRFVAALGLAAFLLVTITIGAMLVYESRIPAWCEGLNGLVFSYQHGIGEGSDRLWAVYRLALIGGWLLPTMILGTVGVWRGWRQRLPASVGAFRQLAVGALPCAAILLFAYTAVALATLQTDSTVRCQVEALLKPGQNLP